MDISSSHYQKSRELKFILNFYKICHILGTTAYSYSGGRFKTLLIQSCYLIFILSLIAFSLFGYQSIIQNTKTTEVISEYLQIAAPILSHFVIAVETIVKRDYDRKILKRISKIESYNFPNFVNFERKFIILCIWFNVMGCAIEACIVLMLGENERKWRLNICVRILTFIIGRMLLLQYLLFIAYVKYKLNDLELSLNLMTVGRTRAVRKMYMNLWKLLITINYRFGFSLMSLVLSLFFCDVVAIYWICVRLRFRKLIGLTASSLTAIPPTMTLVILYVYAQSFNNQVGSFKTKLHSIYELKLNDPVKNAHNLKILKTINLISLAMLQMELKLNICGCIILGYDQFQEVLASLIQYLFIFISFSGF